MSHYCSKLHNSPENTLLRLGSEENAIYLVSIPQGKDGGYKIWVSRDDDDLTRALDEETQPTTGAQIDVKMGLRTVFGPKRTSTIKDYRLADVVGELDSDSLKLVCRAFCIAMPKSEGIAMEA